MDLETVQQYVRYHGYWAVAVGTLVDHSGLQAFVVAGGIVASATKQLTFWGVALAGASGSLVSDAVLFGIGRWRARWLERVTKSEKNRMRLVVLQQGVKRWGFWLLVFGRFLPWMGRFVPAAAGLRRYNGVRAMLYALVGSLIAGFGYASLGYFATEVARSFEDYAIYAGVGALLVSFPVAYWLVKRFDRIVERRMTAERAVIGGDVRLAQPAAPSEEPVAAGEATRR